MPKNRDRDDYTPAELDRVLDLYLAGRGMLAIAQAVGRSSKQTIENLTWKLATGYNKTTRKYEAYQPVAREDRTEDAWTKRDLRLFRLWKLHAKRSKLSPLHIARVLNRSLTEVNRHLKRPGGFGL